MLIIAYSRTKKSPEYLFYNACIREIKFKKYVIDKSLTEYLIRLIRMYAKLSPTRLISLLQTQTAIYNLTYFKFRKEALEQLFAQDCSLVFKLYFHITKSNESHKQSRTLVKNVSH